jgi:hypothetical protein
MRVTRVTMVGGRDSTMHCPQCGLPAQIGWVNCPRCGTRLLEAGLAVIHPIPPPSVPHRSWWSIATIVVALLAVVAVVAGLSANDFGTHDLVKATRGNLASTKSQLAVTQGQLSSMQAKLNQTNQALASAQSQLTNLKKQLADAQGQLGAQSDRICILKICLTGADQSLSDSHHSQSSHLEAVALYPRSISTRHP